MLDVSPWIGALLVHGILACVILGCQKNLNRSSVLKIVCYGILIFVVCRVFNLSQEVFCMFTVVPLVEEVVFRMGVDQGFKNIYGDVWWSLYASALFFSLMHSWPIVERLWSLDVAIPPGAFVLGCVTGFLYRQGYGLITVVVVHSLGNMASYVLSRI